VCCLAESAIVRPGAVSPQVREIQGITFTEKMLSIGAPKANGVRKEIGINDLDSWFCGVEGRSAILGATATAYLA
jgi:hypothetical protein